MSPAAEAARRYVNPFSFGVVIFALLLLTAASFGLSHVALSPKYELAFSLVFAVAKASLVALFFMRLIQEPASNQIAFLTAVAFVVVMLVFVVSDVVERGETLEIPPPAGIVQTQAPPAR